MTALQGSFQDFDELAEAIAGWDLHWRQVEAGPLEATLTQYGHDAVLLTHVSFSLRFFQSGGTPPGTRAFGIMGAGAEPIKASGREMNDRSIFPFPSDYEAVSGAGFAAHTIALSEEALIAAGRAMELEAPLERALEKSSAIIVDANALHALRECLDLLVFGAPDHPPTSLQAAAIRNELAVELPILVACALASSELSHHRESSRPPANRDKIARRARAFLEDHADEAPTIAAVSDHLGVSRRTLEYAFREHVGVSPKQYLQALRLQGVRRELKRATRETRVADAAGRWGFWHMGQLAADYRRWFGERPSETLLRACGPASSG